MRTPDGFVVRNGGDFEARTAGGFAMRNGGGFVANIQQVAEQRIRVLVERLISASRF